MTRMARLIAVAALLCFPVVGVTQEPLTIRERQFVVLYQRADRMHQLAERLRREIEAFEKDLDALAKADAK